jgi:GNAT superfamily N-acetyltransferase
MATLINVCSPPSGGTTYAISKWQPDECPAKSAAYLRAIDDELHRPGGQGMFAFEHSDLVACGASIFGVFAQTGASAEFAGALYSTIDAGGQQWIKGAIVAPAFRGIGLLKVLASYARLHARDDLGHASESLGVVRVYPDGSVNTPSLRSFVAAGLTERLSENRLPIKGERFDRHLLATAEEGGTFRSITLRGDASSLPTARAVIQAWED